MRIAFSLLIILHGLIHGIGFAKGLNLAKVSELSTNISRPVAVIWLLCAIAFIVAGIMYYLKKSSWWWVVLPAVALSQLLIFSCWRDAMFGTVANVVILIPAVITALSWLPGSYSHRYKAAVSEGLRSSIDTPLVTEADLAHLPEPVKNYLHYTGAVGRARVDNFKLVFTGDFRKGLDSGWMRFRSEQHNFIRSAGRYFLMNASLFGVPMEGLHIFGSQGATYQIKVASLLQVVDAQGPIMDKSETVTLFNDICLFAPGALIDKQRITWELIDASTVKAIFTLRENAISAKLSFNELGELTNFVSDDRYYCEDGKTYTNCQWTTPARNYVDIGGRKLPGYGEAIWHMPEGDFCYGKFNLVDAQYNLSVPQREL